MSRTTACWALSLTVCGENVVSSFVLRLSRLRGCNDSARSVCVVRSVYYGGGDGDFVPLPLDHFFFCFLPPVAAGAYSFVNTCVDLAFIQSARATYHDCLLYGWYSQSEVEVVGLLQSAISKVGKKLGSVLLSSRASVPYRRAFVVSTLAESRALPTTNSTMRRRLLQRCTVASTSEEWRHQTILPTRY